MATPLQWRNIDVPNTGSALGGVIQAGQAIGDSFRSIGQLFADNTSRRRTEATDRAVAEAAMAADLDGINALRGAIDPKNRMIDNARLADALNARGSQIRADRSADTEYGIVRNRIDGAPARLLALEHAQRTGDLSQMPGGDAAFEYLDAALNQRTSWQGQQNNERDYKFGERKFKHEQSQDAFRNALAERQLKEQINARRAAAEASNADRAIFSRATARFDELAREGKLSPADISTQVNREFGSSVRSAGGVEALNAAIAYRAGALGSETSADRLTRGTVSDADTALRAANGYQQTARDNIASQFAGEGLLEMSERFRGKTAAEAYKDAGVDKDRHTVAEFTNEVNKVLRDNPGISRADAMAITIEALDTRWYGRGTTTDDDIVKAGVEALRTTRQAGTKEDREREIQTGDREVGKAAASLASLGQREQLAAAAGADPEVIGQIRQQRQDAALELDALLKSRRPAAAGSGNRPYRGAPEGRGSAPVAAKPFFFQYPTPGR